ncbi:MAG: anthranilate phosphoribosyltransferase [Alphaproteobacteria bacterium]|nr:anthranilate phosphoribosyltransferase [Alphaproteobacteria bacterium]
MSERYEITNGDEDSLSEELTIQVMTAIMEGYCPEKKIISFLTELHERGETVAEITGAARVLRAKAQKISAPPGALDCCGTGGDNAGTLNISAGAALVIAACGVPVAKHGNRASTSQSGAADVLEAMGANLNMPLAALEEALKLFHFAFLMAPYHHAAFSRVSSARKAIPHRTIFNLIGPLANPAGAEFQLLGVFGREWMHPLAEVLRNLGTKRAWIVHGSDGLDEITTTGPTHVVTLDENGTIAEMTLTPADFGLEPAHPETLKGGTAGDNAMALRALLEGWKSPYRDIVLANAAAALVIQGAASDLRDGMERAAAAIDEGHALRTLKDYIAFSRETLADDPQEKY